MVFYIFRDVDKKTGMGNACIILPIEDLLPHKVVQDLAKSRWWFHLVPYGQQEIIGIDGRSHSEEIFHDDVIRWKYFPHYCPFVREIHRSPVNSPRKGQWRRALMSCLICSRIKTLSKQSWVWWLETPSHPLWRHCKVWRFGQQCGCWWQAIFHKLPSRMYIKLELEGFKCILWLAIAGRIFTMN